MGGEGGSIREKGTPFYRADLHLPTRSSLPRRSNAGAMRFMMRFIETGEPSPAWVVTRVRVSVKTGAVTAESQGPGFMKSALKTMTGIITIVQEGRFKMEPEDGQPMLFVLAPSAPIEPQDLPGLQRSQARVTVHYEDADTLIAGVVHDIGWPEPAEGWPEPAEGWATRPDRRQAS